MNLKTITLTVNNICNMKCPHCYLQLNTKNKDYISNNLVNKILKSKFNHLVIVGQECLVNKEHTIKTEKLISKLKNKGFIVSLITNGKNINLLSKSTLKKIDYIDISFDGGPKTYSRSWDYNTLTNDIKEAVNKGLKEVNVLHTLYSENIDQIDDLVKVQEITKFKYILFSPYLITANYGANLVSKLPIDIIFKKLSESEEFMKAKNTYILIDKYHLEQQNNIKLNKLNKLIEKYNLKKKIKLFEKDALAYGIIRVTYDGLVLTPAQSLNPRLYSEGIDLNKTNEPLEKIYKELVKRYSI